MRPLIFWMGFGLALVPSSGAIAQYYQRQPQVQPYSAAPQIPMYQRGYQFPAPTPPPVQPMQVSPLLMAPEPQPVPVFGPNGEFLGVGVPAR